MAACFKKVLGDFGIKKFDYQHTQCYIQNLRSIKKIIKENKLIWDTQKSTEDEEKWDQKREERAKEINENKYLK